MSWLGSSIRTSIMGLLGAPPEPGDTTIMDQSEAIRDSMMSVLGDDAQTNYPALTRRIRYADDIHSLWFLRSELMGALAAMYGEHKAREIVKHISEMFQGMVSDAKPSKGGRFG